MKFERIGGRRYILAWGVLLICSGLQFFGKLNSEAYAAIILGSVCAYIAGNVGQRHIEGKALERESSK